LASQTASSDAEYAWSPDGQQIIFRNDTSEIFLVSTGGQEDSLSTPLDMGVRLSWLPDGQKIAYSNITNHDPLTAYIFDLSSKTVTEEIKFHDHLRGIDASGYLWNQAYNKVAFIQPEGQSGSSARHLRLYILDFSKPLDPPTYVTTLEGQVDLQAWSQDGSEIFYISNYNAAGKPNPDGDENIYAVHIDTGAIREVVLLAGCEKHPAWSPSGDNIALSSSNRNNWDVFLYSMASGTTTNLTNSQHTDEFQPTWSPDGLSIVFVGFEDVTDRDIRQEIYVIPADGTGTPLKVTDTAQQESLPMWSPDGKNLAYLSFDGSAWTLKIVDSEEFTPVADIPIP
jgi:Tol biopolymer transport system component